MADNSIAAELLLQINLSKLQPTPNYLSPSDAMRVEEFEQSEFGTEYSLDVSNIEWGNASNDSHIFDIYNKFTTHRDSSMTRLDMLNFVALNNERYKWDCHVFFMMHEVYLDTWLKKMAYWGTKADELSIYALSDMLKVHTFIVTKNRPWTTIDTVVQGTPTEIMYHCPVKLAYLGDNRFGRLWPKIVPTPSVSTLQTNVVSVFPISQPLVNVPAPPTLAELETANTLLTMQQTMSQAQLMVSDTTNNLNLQEPKVTTAYQPSELILDIHQTPSIENPEVELLDAMDKLVDHEDVSFSEPKCWLKRYDCMDAVTGRINDLVDLIDMDNLFACDSTQTKPCRVELVRLKYKPTVRLPTLQTQQDLLALGEYFTRSKTKAKKPRKNRRPRSTNTDVNYEESASSSDQSKTKKRTSNRNKSAPQSDGPTAAQVHAQKTTTQTPPVRLPALEIDKPVASPVEVESEPPPPVINTERDLPTRKRKGSFTTRSFTLRKKKRVRKYGCKLCSEILDSAHLLSVHHRNSHGILYCETCNKAFNNPTSLVRHSYQHKPLRFHCACGASFAFSSQLQTHSVVHRRHASHHCVYPKCNRSFKNKGDLKWHAEEHYSALHECPDCDYKNSDIRNLESHRLKHSDIINYTCCSCGQGFKYNTQLRRHKNDPNKCPGPKRSESPEF